MSQVVKNLGDEKFSDERFVGEYSSGKKTYGQSLSITGNVLKEMTTFPLYMTL